MRLFPFCSDTGEAFDDWDISQQDYFCFPDPMTDPVCRCLYFDNEDTCFFDRWDW